MIGTWKKQFSLKQLYLTHDNPESFLVSQWQKERSKSSISYIVYRSVISLWFLVTIILSVVSFINTDNLKVEAKWLIYLTNWGYTTCTLQALILALMIVLHTFSSRERINLRRNILGCYSIYWVLNIIATDIAFGITTIYWSLLYQSSMGLDVMNLFVHGLNSCFMLLDLFVVSHPVRLLHFIYPILFGLLYVLFTIIYYETGGTNIDGTDYIYTILKWSEPGKTVLICFGVLVFIVVIHLFTWGLYKIRIWIYGKFFLEGNGEYANNKTTSNGGYDNPALATDVV